MAELTEVELLSASLERVWNERDQDRRLAALADIYHPDAILFEASGPVAGARAISETVAALLGGLPRDFRFRPYRALLGHHGTALGHWQGESEGMAIVSGYDVARIEEGRIRTIHVFIEAAPAA